MGYTHYFYRSEILDQKHYDLLVEDVKFLLDHLPEHSLNAGGYHKDDHLIIRGGWGTGKPTVNNQLISFNGDEATELDHETMDFPRVLEVESWQTPDHGLYFQCCKTARKPYDLVVCATLLAIKYHFPKTKISSDGFPSDWVPAVVWYKTLFPDRTLGIGPWLDNEGE